MILICLSLFFFYCYGHHRDLHVLTHSFPTRRSSDRPVEQRGGKRRRPACSARCVGRHQPPPGHVERRLRTAHHPGIGDMDMDPCNQFVEHDGLGDIVHPAGTKTLDDMRGVRSEEHTSELQSLMRHSYAVFRLKKTQQITTE